MIVAEGRYNRRLEIIKDLPRASVRWLFDQTDMANAEEVLRDTACIAGNVPASLLVTGTAQDVKAYCRKSSRSAAEAVAISLPGVRVSLEGNRLICTL